MENRKSTFSAVDTCGGFWLLATALAIIPVTSASAEVVPGDLIVRGAACIGTECTADTYPFDALRIHGPEPVLSMVDESTDGSPSHNWSMGITDDGTTDASDFFIRDDTYGVQVLRMTATGAVAFGAGASIVDDAISVGAMGNERRVAFVADAVDDTDAVNLRQFEAFQDRALDSVGGDAGELEQQLADINKRIEDLARRIDNLSRRMQ